MTSCRTSPEQREAKFLERGDALIQQKEYTRAILEYRNAVSARPTDAEAFYRLGVAYEKSGNVKAAIGSYRQALAKNAQHAGAQLKLAQLGAAYGDERTVGEAEKRLLDLVTKPSSDSETMDALAVAELRLGKADEAARLLEDAASKYPSDIAPAVLLARFKLQQNDVPGAERALQDAVHGAPKSAAAAVALGRFYLQTHRPDQAESELRRALALDSQFAPALLSLARLESDRNQPDQAEQVYRQLSTNADSDYQSLYALFLLQHGKTDAALKEFQRLARQNQDDRTARSRLVAAYVTAHREQEAEKVLTAALKQNPKDTEALMQRAGLLLRTSDFAAAERDLDQVIHQKPDSAPAHYEFAIAKRLQGLASSERQELQQAILHDQSYLPARLALARDYLQANESSAAKELLDSTPPQQKNIREVRVDRNWAVLGLGDMKAARAEIDQLLKASRTTDALEQDGYLHMVERNFTAARQDAEEILAQTPEDTRAVKLLADAYASAGQRAAGLQRLREFAAARPKSATLQFAVGRVLLAAGDRENARKSFETAFAADPKLLDAELELGHVDFLDNHLDSARKRVAAVLALQPRNVTALSAAGDIELQARSYTTAMEKYRAVLEIDPSNVPVMVATASLLVATKDMEEARRLAEHAVELAPANPLAQDTLAWVEYSTGDYGPSAEHLKSAMKLAPTLARQYHLALAYIKGGQSSLGRPLLAAALQKDPNLPQKDSGW